MQKQFPLAFLFLSSQREKKIYIRDAKFFESSSREIYFQGQKIAQFELRVDQVEDQSFAFFDRL